MDKGDDESFLDRWSRLKRKEQTEPAAPDVASSTAPPRTGSPEQPGEIDTPVDPATLPDIDELTATSDVSAFLKKGVPDHLKQLAVRRVWSLDPAIRDFVEMAENQYDWNVPGGVPGFGEIAAGTDMKALLAQAIGQGQPPAEAKEDGEVAASGGGTDPESSIRVAATDFAAGDAPGAIEQTSEPVSESAERIAPAVLAGAEPAPRPPDAAAPPQRRHGGALPQPPDDRV